MFASNQSLGIDIRDDKLRLAHLVSKQGTVTLLHYASIPLPPLHKGHLSEYESIFISTLKHFIAENQVQTEQIVVGLPQKDIIFRGLEVPAVKHEEIRQILEFEIERHVPFPLQDIYFDFKIIGPKGGSNLELTLVAAKKERVNYLLSLLETAQIPYTRLELTTFAIFSGIHFQDKKSKRSENYLIVEVGLHDVELGVIQKGEFVFSHRLIKQVHLNDLGNQAAPPTITSPGMENIEEQIKQESIAIEELEQLTPSLDKDKEETEQEENQNPDEETTPLEEIEEDLSSVNDNSQEPETQPNPLKEASDKLADKLKREISFLITSLQKTHQDTNLGHIFLSGIDACATLAKSLQEATQIETTLWDPLTGINAPETEQAPTTELGVAIGLALEGLETVPQGFNFLPPEEQEAQKKTQSLVLPIVLGALMVLLAIGNGASYLIRERTHLNEIEEKIAQLQPAVRAVEKATKRYQQLKDRKEHLDTITRQPASLLAVLKELTIKLPSDVWLERFKLNKNEIEIGGFAKSASSLIPVLEDSPLFKDVEFIGAIISKGGGKEKFKLQITLER